MSYYAKLHLDPDEKVILEVRKHWIVFLGNAIGTLASALFPFVIYFIAKRYVPGLENITVSINGNVSALLLFLYCLWLLILWGMFFVSWTKYFLDVWYVTEKRIIAVDQKQLFNREVSNLRFDKIQDVTLNIGGFIATFFNFGTIKVQTASEDNIDFYMSMVANPEHVRNVIFSQHNEIGDKSERAV